jgi:hypothetical protein
MYTNVFSTSKRNIFWVQIILHFQSQAQQFPNIYASAFCTGRGQRNDDKISSRVDLQMIENKFFPFPVIFIYVGCLPLRYSLIFCKFPTKIELYKSRPTNSSYFTTSQEGGQALIETKVRLTQPSLVELGLGLSLANL